MPDLDDFDALVADAVAQPVRWDFAYLDGRAIEERPSWRYFDRVVDAVARAERMLDFETGSGNLETDLPHLPPLTIGTDAYRPSLAAARPRFAARGAQLACAGMALPFRDSTFDLVVSRHPVDTPWAEIARVLRPDGRFLSQQVGPHSLRDLSERLLGPLPPNTHRDPEAARLAAEAAGLVVHDLQHERTRAAFFDIGAVVYFLRVVPWIVPGFDAGRFTPQLRSLHAHIGEHGSFETTSSRFLIDATRAT
jgi:SAM-dependent methyltransferase